MYIWLVAFISEWILLSICLFYNNVNFQGFSFFQGLILAYICFWFLRDFYLDGFIFGGMGLIAGVGIGVLAEFILKGNIKKIIFLGCSLFTILVLLDIFVESYIIVKAVPGGALLYISNAILLRERDSYKNNIFAYLLGLLGFFIGIFICF